MPESSSAANGGTLGRWNVAMATTTCSASKTWSPALMEYRLSCRVSRSTRMPVRTGSLNLEA